MSTVKDFNTLEKERPGSMLQEHREGEWEDDQENQEQATQTIRLVDHPILNYYCNQSGPITGI